MTLFAGLSARITKAAARRAERARTCACGEPATMHTGWMHQCTKCYWDDVQQLVWENRNSF